MDNDKNPSEKLGELREQVGRKLRSETVPLHEMSAGDITALVRELRIHQVELEMQNEKLRRALSELEQSRTKYTELFDSAPIGYFVVDPHGVIIEVNTTGAAMLKQPGGRLIGKPFSLYVALEDKETFRQHLHAVFVKEAERMCELRLVREGGPEMIVRLRSRPVKDESGKVVRCHSAVANITALATAERRLRGSERRFRTLAENSPDVIARVDRAMHVLYINKPIEKVLGLPAEQFLGRTFDELGVPEDLAGTWTAKIRNVFQTATPGRLEFDCRTPDGLRHYSAVLVPEFGEEHTVGTVLVNVRDVTEQQAARDQLSFQARVLKDISDAVVAIDNERRVTYWNEAAERLYDVSAKDALGQKLDDLHLWPWLSPEAEEAACNELEQRGVWQGVTTQTKSNGEKLSVRISLSVLDDNEGNRIGHLAVIHDETRQKEALEGQMRTLRRLELVAQATNDGIWDWDVRTNTLWHNDAYATTFGYDPDEAGTSPEWWRERIHPDDRELVLSTLDDILQGSEDRWMARYRFRRKDGRYAWVMARAYVLRDEQGKAVRMSGAMLDLTEKLDLRDQLESERAKLGTILETAMVGIVVVDDKARITYANPTAQAMYGHAAPFGEELGVHTHVEICHPDGRAYDPRELPVVRSALHGETYSEVDVLVRWPDGHTRFLLINTSPLQNAQGRITGAVEVLHDITQLKQAEQDLREAHHQLEERVRQRTTELDNTVATLHEEVAEKLEAQRQLIHQNEMLQKIVNNIPVMLCFCDAEGNVGMINDEFTRVLGYSLKDLQKHELMELRYPDPADRQEAWDYMLAAEPGWRDFLVQRKQGGKVTSSWASVRLSDGSYLGIGIDIRERKRWENRLRESEERYRTLVELSPDAIGVERDGVIQFVNSTAVTMLKAETAQDLVGRSILDFVHPDHRKRAERQFRYLRRRRKPLPLTEEKIVCLDGAVLDVEMVAMPIAFETKPANQIVVRDITRRKEAEARLQQNARQLQQQAELLDLAHDSIVVNDMEGRIVFWSHGAEQTFGWTRDEAMGRISHELLKTRFPLNLIEITAKLLSQGRWNGELTHTTRTGETIVVSSRWALQRDPDGRPTGILLIDRDVTQQKHAEQTTLEARRFAESITDTIQESLLVLSRDLKVVSANETFYRTFQVRPEETEGQYVYEIDNRLWDIPELRKLLEGILPHNTSLENFEVERDFKHIGYRTMLLNARRIYRQMQETELILLAIRDITVRKEQEKKIREHQHQLATLTEELLLTEERERHRIALMLHDSIGQSLSFSKRELGVLQKSASDSAKDTLEHVKQQIDEAIRETRSLTFELSPTTLHTFGLEAAVEELAEQFAQRGHFHCHFEATDEDKPLTEQIKTLLFRAGRELLTNIIKHAAASNVFIRIDRLDGTIRMIIEDDGKGFHLSRLEQVFRQQEGFGLFSIRERLTYVGGVFSIESQPGEGTKVTLIAPLHSTHKNQET